VAPGVLEKVPVGQATQVSAEVAPKAAEKVPAGQMTGAWLEGQ
jgi:hypothetical protein